jgi:hypothetical protein
MTENLHPLFLQNSPSGICDQILYLVKNSNLNFELHETPFSLNLNIKKSFAHHWNRQNQSAHQAEAAQAHVPQHDSNPVHHHPLHYPSDGQLSASQAKNILHTHQHRSNSPQHHALAPQVYAVPAHGLQQQQQQHPNNLEIVTDQAQQASSNSELSTKFDRIQAEKIKIEAEHLEVHQEYAELDKSHRKLYKEHKELQAKHSKICLELKTLKTEKETILKNSNALDVALQSSRKQSEDSFRKSLKEKEALREELANLNQFKSQYMEEVRKAKKAEKKLRQKEKKQSGNTTDKVIEESEPVCEDHSKEKSEQLKSEDIKPSDEIKDKENNLEFGSETSGFKSEEDRFAKFPSCFADWSEDQKKDAMDNNFMLYFQKYFFIPTTGSLPTGK